MGLVEKAERKSRARAIIGYLLAATLLASAILAIRGHSDGAARLAPRRLPPWAGSTHAIPEQPRGARSASFGNGWGCWEMPR